MARPDDYEFPADATPLRKVAAAYSWADDKLLKQFMAEARDAGIPKKLIDFAARRREFDIVDWQEALVWLNPQEQAMAAQTLRDVLGRSTESSAAASDEGDPE